MTIEEEKEFRQKVIDTIFPYAVNMTETQIRNIIQNVEKNNKELPEGFSSMLFQQIIIYKYNMQNR